MLFKWLAITVLTPIYLPSDTNPILNAGGNQLEFGYVTKPLKIQ